MLNDFTSTPILYCYINKDILWRLRESSLCRTTSLSLCTSCSSLACFSFSPFNLFSVTVTTSPTRASCCCSLVFSCSSLDFASSSLVTFSNNSWFWNPCLLLSSDDLAPRSWASCNCVCSSSIFACSSSVWCCNFSFSASVKKKKIVRLREFY